jgi:hypothetical protein
MMDFLRRLAPARESDRTRAVAVLPSRFANDRPLRTTTVEASPSEQLDEEALFSHAASEEHAPLAAPTALHGSINRVRVTEAEPPYPLSASARGYTSETHPFARADLRDARVLAAAETRRVEVRHDENSEHRDSLATPEHRLSNARSASHSARSDAATSAAASTNAPLSQAAINQRAHQSRADSEVVHVTIGRIEVVASPSPAGAVRSATQPRASQVTLADYLRGSTGNGSRR